jgi:hypothetical protein
MKAHGQRLEPGMWAPGKDVMIQDGKLHCRLDFERAYRLAGESAGFLETPFQRGQPHLEFLRVKDEAELERFVERWGPIVMNPDERVTGISINRLGLYWFKHRYLTRVVDLLAAFRRGSSETGGLGGFLELRSDWLHLLHAEAEVQGWKVHKDVGYLQWLNGFVNKVWGLPKFTGEKGARTGEEGQITTILEAAPLDYVRRLMDHTISSCFAVTTVSQPIRPKPRPEQRRILLPRLKVDELEKLLEYLIFLDEWSDHPLRQCEDCGGLFRSETRHRRLYCGTDCANRVSSREYKRAIRAKQKRDLTRRKPR